MADSESRNLILGTATGYGWAEVERFVTSFREAEVDAELVLLTDPEGAEKLGGASGQGSDWRAEVVPGLGTGRPISVRWAGIRRARVAGRLALWSTGWLGRAWRNRLVRRCLHPMVLRNLWYREFLEGGDWDRVLLSDVRDVLFQRCPFGGDESAEAWEGLLVGEEAGVYRNGELNHAWATVVFGREFADDLVREKRVISCAGVVGGRIASLRQYLDLMADQIESRAARLTFLAGLDQAIHNRVIGDFNGPGRITRVGPLSGLIGTLGFVERDRIRRDSQGRILSEDSEVIAVAHQYDRQE